MSARNDARAEERARRLITGALDGELSPAERGELESMLDRHPALREELQRLRRVKEVTESMALRPASEEVWRDYWASVYSRIERGIGWVLLSLGAIVLVSYGVWMAVSDVIADTEMPWYIKAGLLAVTVGGVILLVSVLREKVFVWRRQRYKDVDL
ncbi:MAG: hypothetical protein JSU87_05110 [Gemmatimonadota bacterium]|nr:MAG: hypothetical protein JSU87_05110 [Gemmatimonadota bacterium]